jgi:putative ABC transport system substrate-binding protein
VGRAQQQAAPPVVGYLGTYSDKSGNIVTAFLGGLSETGYVEGRTVAVEYRFAEGHLERLPALADDLVGHPVAVIVATSTPATLAAKTATKSIPVVFQISTDPVDIGVVVSLNRPGGNLTGIANLGAALAVKRLEVLHELLPSTTLIAYLVNQTSAVFADIETKALQDAARNLGIRLLLLNASEPREFEAAFSTLVRERAGGLLVGGDGLFFTQSDRLVALAAHHTVPTVYSTGEAAVAGGLMSYAADIPDAVRQAGVYAGRILQGEKPADLPVQQVTKMELVINMKTAKALGLTFPTALLIRADQVIE